MRTLYVMRHCKSRWDEPEASDHERGLTKRGKRDARLLGQALAERAAPPGRIVCSTARRARATARRVARSWGYEGEISQQDAIYEGGPLQCLGVLRNLPDETESALLIGHNPTLENLLWTLGLARLPLATGEVVCLLLALDSWGELSLASQAQERFRLEPGALRDLGD